jgi:hypothetical protein
MTCKDCYHYEKCYFDALKESHLTGNDYREIVCIDNQIICKFFKDKSLIIELPCKVGDKVYYLSIKSAIPLTYKIVEGEVLNYNINRYGICGVKIKQLNSDYIFGISIDKIFLTKEEAETKLKELNGNE